MSVVPTVAIPVTANPNATYIVELAARSEDDGGAEATSMIEGQHFRSEPITINANTPQSYTARISFEEFFELDENTNTVSKKANPTGTPNVIQFGLRTIGTWYTGTWQNGWDPAYTGSDILNAPLEWKNEDNPYLLTFDEIIVNKDLPNETAIGNDFGDNLVQPGTYHPLDHPAAGRVDASLWNGYAMAYSFLTDNAIRSRPSNPAFRIEQGNIMYIDVTFTVKMFEHVTPLPRETDYPKVRLQMREAQFHATASGIKSDVLEIKRNGTYTLEADVPMLNVDDAMRPITDLADLAVMSDGSDFRGAFGFRGKARQVPQSWWDSKEDIKITFNQVALAGPDGNLVPLTGGGTNSLGSPSGNTFGTQDIVGQGFLFTEGFINASLWNAWDSSQRLLTGVDTIGPNGRGGATCLRIAGPSNTRITKVSVTFTVTGIPFSATTCEHHSEITIEPNGCEECLKGGTTTPPRNPGRIINPTATALPAIGDVLELLKFLAGITPNAVGTDNTAASWQNALLTQGSRNSNRPGIGDALEILKCLAKIKPNLVENPLPG
jgi:hypothetical protein